MTLTPQQVNDLQETIEEIVDRYHKRPTALIMVLQDVQKTYNYLPQKALRTVADYLQLPIAQIYGVATFYKAFSLKPKGRHHVCVCTGTACHVRQARTIVEKMQRDLGIKAGETTADGEFSLETVNCLGACALGPLVTIDSAYHGSMTVSRVDKVLQPFRTEAHSVEADL
jgi:NADH-quinone oxidoreductase subunit E